MGGVAGVLRSQGLLKGLNGGLGEVRGGLTWGAIALKPIMACDADFRSQMTIR